MQIHLATARLLLTTSIRFANKADRSSRDRRRDEAEVSGVSDGPRKMRQINTALWFTSRPAGQEL